MMQFFLIRLLLASRRRQIRDLAELAVGGEKGSTGEALFPGCGSLASFRLQTCGGRGMRFVWRRALLEEQGEPHQL
jgi:hypothetical protein